MPIYLSLMKNKSRLLLFYLMIVFYAIAGINHFVNSEFYEKMMPSYVPFHSFCIYFSGICEVVFALLLLVNKTRKIGAWLIIAMLMLFFIIHIQMLIDSLDNYDFLFWISIIRIPMQFVLIWWAWLYTKNPQPKS